jgi:hypothetical protein
MAASQGNPLLDGLLDMKAAKIGAPAPMTPKPNQLSDCWEVVDLSGEKSNQIFVELASWEEVLKGSSLAAPVPATKAKRESVDVSVKSGATV